MNPQDAALEYVRAGLFVVPIPHGTKGPRDHGWQLRENCITSPAQCERVTAGLGLAHLYSGTAAIDFDDFQANSEFLDGHGIDAYALLMAEDAVRIESGRPNRTKLLYRLPQYLTHGLRTIKVDGLEFRCASADGTTVQDVLPPSIHPHTLRPYSWAGTGDWRHIPEIPRSLLELWQRLIRNGTPKANGANGAETDAPVPAGKRHDFLISIAGAMRHRGLGETSIYAGISAANQAQCRPPMDEDEVRTIARTYATRQAKGAISTSTNGEQQPQPDEQSQTDPDQSESAPAPPRAIPFSEFLAIVPKPTQYVLDGWLPAGQVTLLSGDGGIGKSWHALMLTVCIGLGRPFFGIPTARRRCAFISYEDEPGELRRRIERICWLLEVSAEQLDGWLDIYDGTDADVWFTKAEFGRVGFTMAFRQLRESVVANVVVVDGISHTYAGEENNRAQVSAFVRGCRLLGKGENPVTVLLGHDAKEGVKSGANSLGYTGSTAWNNSVRARWFMYAEMEPTDPDDKFAVPVPTGNIKTVVRKANRGAVGLTLTTAFNADDEVFRAIGQPARTAAPMHRNKATDAIEQVAIRGIIRAAFAAGNPIPTATAGTRSAYHVMKSYPQFPKDLLPKRGKTRLYEHLERLRATQEIIVTTTRKNNRHPLPVYQSNDAPETERARDGT